MEQPVRPYPPATSGFFLAATVWTSFEYFTYQLSTLDISYGLRDFYPNIWKNTLAVDQFSAAFGVTTDDYIIMMSTISILGSPAQLITSLKLHLPIHYVKSHGFFCTLILSINSHMTHINRPLIGSDFFYNSFLNSFLFNDLCIIYFRFFIDLVFFLTNFVDVSLETLLLNNDVCTFHYVCLSCGVGKT